MLVDDSEKSSSCIFSLRYSSDCETHIYGLPTTNISPEVINVIDMTGDFAQKPQVEIIIMGAGLTYQYSDVVGQQPRTDLYNNN